MGEWASDGVVASSTESVCLRLVRLAEWDAQIEGAGVGDSERYVRIGKRNERANNIADPLQQTAQPRDILLVLAAHVILIAKRFYRRSRVH